MQYDNLTEAKRRLAQSQTLYKRLVEKNKKAEEDYVYKIERLQANVDQLTQEAN